MRYSWMLLISFFVGVLISCGNRHRDLQEENNLLHAHDISSLQMEIEKYPDSLLLSQDLVEAYRNAGQYDSAIALTRRLIKRDTGNAYLWNVMATLNYETGNPDSTIHALKKAIAIFPLPDYYFALGSIYAKTGNEEALLIADTLLLQENDAGSLTSAHFIKSMYYNTLKKPALAIREADSSLAINYTYMFAYREKAIALIALKRYREAIDVLKKATKLQNSYDEGYYWMGQAYTKIGQRDSAIQCYENALLYDKNYTEAKVALDELKKD